MKKVRRIFMVQTVVLLAGLLAGCGKPDPDPNSGLYEGVSATMMGMSMDIAEVYENGVTFDMKDGGKCVANLDGEEIKLKWSTDGDSLHMEGGGVELDGTIGGGNMTIVNMMDMGLDMELHCDKLLHSDLADEDKNEDKDDDKSSDKAASGSVLKRLKDAKSGKAVYISKGSSGNDSSWTGDDDEWDADDSDDSDDNGDENGGGPGIWAEFDPDASWYEPKNKLPLTVLQEAEKKMYADMQAYMNENKETPTYEEVRDDYFNGVDGEPTYYEASNFMGDPSAGCIWHADIDGSAYISVSFTGDDEGTLRLEDYVISDSENFPESPRN